MKVNQLRKVLNEGRIALGGGVLTASPEVVEVLGYSGLDFVWLDLQHAGFSAYDSLTLGNLARAAEVSSSSLLVRVPTNAASMIGKVLDSGVHAVLVPEVKSQEEVCRAISAARFGVGGTAGSRGTPSARATRWEAPDVDFAQEANRETMVGIMLENMGVIESLGKEASLEGVDFVFLGLSDLSISLGVPLQTNHPLVAEYTRKALDFCNRVKIPVGIAVSTFQAAKQAAIEGFRIIRLGQDLEILYREFKTMVEGFQSKGV